ncbi:MAG: S8 family peptidase, partial [Steroidobacter sp.]
MKTLVAFALAALAAAPAFAQSKEYQGPAPARAADITDQIVVKWRNGSSTTVTKSSAVQRSSKLTTTAGVALQSKRTGWGNTEVFKLDHMMAKAELQGVLAKLSADPDVEYAVADKRRFAHALPSDPRVNNDQWYLLSAEAAATRTDQAWDVTNGSYSTIVAVLDTGIRPAHPDFAPAPDPSNPGAFLPGKLLPGYDFISEPVIANDGDGRDNNPEDTGDFVASQDRTGLLANCDLSNSSWHGTRVSSLIGATTDEGMGMAGLGWDTRILPVRVLGKCGGRDTDIVDAMLWSAGLTVPNVPLNPNPAKIINLSLGGDGACTPLYQNAINAINAAGTVVVASVGNDGVDVGSPANCDGVVGVGGLRQAGTKVGYSNLGPGTDISAPAGNCVNTTITQATPCVYSILAAINLGSTTPIDDPAGSGYTDRVNRPNFGTSFSAPLVSGAIALLNAVNPALSPAQYSAVIQGTALPFPTTSSTTNSICRVPTTFVQGEECICTTATCGAGMLNTAAAVNALAAPFGVIQAPGTIDVNANISIDARTSFDTSGSSVASYQWSVVNVTGATPTIANATGSNTTLQVTGTSNFTLRLRVTDSAGATDDTDFAMATAVSTTPPSQTPIGGGGGGGGGSFDWWLLLLGLLPLALPGPRRRRPARVRGRVAPRSSLASELHDV